MTKDQFPTRLREARLAMGFSMDKLAERTGYAITKQSISRYEKGEMLPKHDALASLAKALRISEAYFENTNLKIDVPMLRTTSNGKLSEEELKALEAKLSFWAEQYLAKENEVGIDSTFENPILGMKVSTLEDVIQAADLLRDKWRCGDGPIASVLRLLERKGIKILVAELPNHVEGLSTWADKKHPLMILDVREEKTTVERLRFTACHELAHLLLDFSEDSEFDVEKLCNKFASFFLFPRNTFVEELGGDKRESLTMDELIDLKNVYGVSVQAQVHQAWDLRIISHEHYDWWYDERIHQNWKEVGWGGYPFPETLGREKRINSRISTNETEK